MKDSKLLFIYLGLLFTIFTTHIKCDNNNNQNIQIMKSDTKKDIKSVEIFYEAFNYYDFSGVNEFEVKPTNYPFVGIEDYSDSITMNIYLHKTKVIQKTFQRMGNVITYNKDSYVCPQNIIKETQLCLFPQTGVLITYDFIINQNESKLLNITFKYPTFEREYNFVDNLNIKKIDTPFVLSEDDLKNIKIFQIMQEINNYKIQVTNGTYTKLWLRDDEEVIVDSIRLH
jgi:hypothetical protein